MKKIFSLMAVASMTLSVNAVRSPYQDRNYADWGKLMLVGNQLSDRNGDPVQLKGWSTYSLNYKGSCSGEGQWKLMQQYGANIVRLAMPVDDSKDGGSYLAKSGYFKELIKQSIAETKNLNMYCIVDWHITPDSVLSGNPNDYINESKDFFGEISKYCADNGYDNVLYEICNDPTCGWADIKNYAEEVIPVITANQPDAIIIVGTDQWCQRIMEPVSDPIDATYKKNVMYSFHYSACSHYSLLGDFRNAQKKIPVFVSEWSAVKFNGDGPFCASNSDALIAACDKMDAAPQVVSWCLWNWSGRDEASSFFTNNCSLNNLSQYTDENGRKYSDYVSELMFGGFSPCCTPLYEPWSTINTIPSTEASLWNWDYYDKGGEGVAYHDVNSGAYEKDREGVVLDYSNAMEEVDVFSLAKKMMWLDRKCPWSTVEDDKVVAWDESINTVWRDENDNPTYKSLNAGKTYSGTYGSVRPDEGVDLVGASLSGTAHQGEAYPNIGWVEEGEWINYTVKVKKPGYYKIRGIVSAEYNAPLKNGEISIVQDGKNILRDTSALDDETVITSFGFPRTVVCDDQKADVDFEPWNCWTVSDARSDRKKEVLCFFKEAGEQRITIVFNGNAGGIGPLIFDWYKELEPEDPFVCCGGFQPEEPWSTINTIPSTEASLWNWDYYNKGGEGIAYHDLNTGAYKKDSEGIVLDYSNAQEEVDVFSLAKEMQWLNKSCPWSTVKNGKVVAWDESINTTWQDENGKPTYKSLNAGRTYTGTVGSVRPDEGVDLLYASLSGTAHAGEAYTNLGWVEEGEWINYTVKVNKPGYYKIKGIIGADYTASEENGEISIVQDGKNILRDTSALDDETVITSFGFPRTTVCDDQDADVTFSPWNCWTVSDAKSGRYKEVLCFFKEAGEQQIKIIFNGNAGGVGPLIFDWYKELEPEDPFVCCGGGVHTGVNTISSTKSSLWHWDYFNAGGEGVAYHDGNGGAYEKDDDGVIIGYSKYGEEVDVFSLAKEMQWLDYPCPWVTVKDGKVVDWDESINTVWQDKNGKPTYKSLNAARMYDGPYATQNPDEGVDLPYANLRGTAYENLGYTNLGWVEEGEWISYTVNVEKPGYYKISGIINYEYRAPEEYGEISITSSRGNHLRSKNNLVDPDAITTFGFPQTRKCEDSSVDIRTEPWNCWTISDARSGREKEVFCAFPEAGEQTITIAFSGNAGGVGPLIFDFYKDLEPEDPFSWGGGINTISSTKASLWYWNYYDNGGEGFAYHDGNSGAYEKDDDGVIIDYSNVGDEVDVFSLAKEMQWLNDPCPWSTVKDDKVVAWDKSINTVWQDENKNPTYKSLNGGRSYFGANGSIRPDEGVDLTAEPLRGTAYENKNTSAIGWVEEGEWIKYTVNVEKPGYYKISGVIGAEYRAPEKNGEISITSSRGNLLRSKNNLADPNAITTFGFPVTTKCDDKSVDPWTEPWYCWTVSDAKSGREKEVYCVFPEAGEQTITIAFNENAGGVGPLIFEWYTDFDMRDPVIGGPSAVNDVDATKFSINPNPTSGEFTVILADNVEASVEVINTAGQIAVSQNIVGSATIKKALVAGVYTVVVKTNGGVSTQKLVVK